MLNRTEDMYKKPTCSIISIGDLVRPLGGASSNVEYLYYIACILLHM